MKAGVNRAAAGARDFFAEGVLGGRRKQRAEDKDQKDDWVTKVKVIGILMSLLLILYVLSFVMAQRGSETAPLEEWQRTGQYPGQTEVLADAQTQPYPAQENKDLLPDGWDAKESSSNAVGDSDSNIDGNDLASEDDNEVVPQSQLSPEALAALLEETPDIEADEMVSSAILALASQKVSSPFSTYDIPGVDPVKDAIFLVNGTLTNAYKSVLRDRVPQTRQDLPRVFPRDVAVFYKNVHKRKTVCVYTRTPRQDSLFRTNFMSMFASGDYNYVIMRSTDCQHEGKCSSPEEARSHARCDPDLSPTVHLLERIKNFQHERFEQVLSNGVENYDVLVATGDEFCRALHTYDRAHFRMYAGPKVVNASQGSPIYLPLGPREEFKRVYANDVRLVRERKYKFNFMGSLTSLSRKVLVKELGPSSEKYPSFVWVVSKWKKQLTRANGYITPVEYKQILVDSVFTLCPQGHNPEAYRIYEACEAGSIPIVVLDEYYRSHECEGAFLPLITQGAPFVFLNSWTELPAYLEYILQHPERIQQMQMDTMEWYSKFMTKVATQFETVMTLRFSDRSESGKFTSTRSIPSIRTYLDDAAYSAPLQKPAT
ncbi:UDP-D-xylose:ribitol-5-phosphate beta1,4-xylosyltransferase [Hondaea fermentalgiana]|uniref:UDP-D-xylose:ribitol-5-phosphate beta1,4-xylosyltransferase n=1 Tax=Hondaea fermentalgiana TaxID=2315210 RepID=A0A2R5GRG6_9STRA|nr:UDP-D-xylose:ribitol-5-phosphate beta1,4-xylosyltransferase [Hondaea fermentalgiana]|eukprot:GBG33472.1 UDP-D-xylose:ribitol-5-phosphate beta1,4-xylosyltransferase [Hondaea fermentalgiana]